MPFCTLIDAPEEGQTRFYEGAAVLPQQTGRGHLDNLVYTATKQNRR